MRGDQDRGAARQEFAQRAEQRVAADGVHAVERLVEEEYVGLLGDGAGQQDALALAAGEGAEAVPRPVGDPHQASASAAMTRSRFPGRRSQPAAR